jgi:hypothetical protein
MQRAKNKEQKCQKEQYLWQSVRIAKKTRRILNCPNSKVGSCKENTPNLKTVLKPAYQEEIDISSHSRKTIKIWFL